MSSGDLDAPRTQLRAHSGEEEHGREEHDAEHVVRGTLHVGAGFGGCRVRFQLELLRLRSSSELVLGHGERRQRRVGVLERSRGDPGVDGRLELRAEARKVEVGQLGLLLRVRVDPLRERRHVDLGLRVREIGRASGLDAWRAGAAERFGLLAVPAAGLVAAPRGGDRRQREEHGCGDLDPVGLVARVGAHSGSPCASQGRRTSAPIAVERLWAILNVRSMATGRRPPTPVWKGCRGSRAAATSRR